MSRQKKSPERNLVVSNVKSLEPIERIHKLKFDLPDLENLLYFARKEVKLEDQVIAAGFLKLTSEAIFTIDNSLPRSVRVRAITALLEEMVAELKAFNVDETHVFLSGPREEETRKFLKSFGFKDATGTPMFFETNNGKKRSESSQTDSNAKRATS